MAKRLTLVFRSFMFKGIRAKGLHGESDMFEMIVDLNLKRKKHFACNKSYGDKVSMLE